MTSGRRSRLTPPSRTRAQAFPSVCVAQGSNEDTPAQILQAALEGVGGIGRFVKPGQTVAIKANATWAYAPHTASSTDPDFLTAVIEAVRAAGAARIIVMDHCSIEPGAAESVRISGIGRVVKSTGVEGLFPDRYDAPPSTYTQIELPQGRANQTIGVIKAAVEADVRINLAVPKSHSVTRLTMCLKHMMGFLQKPGTLHVSLDQGIADLSTGSAIQAQLHLLEALRVRKPYGSYQVCAGPETDLTHPHIVERRNIVIAGVDPVLIDAYGCIHLFDRDPQELAHLVRAHDSGCGDLDVEAAQADGRIISLKVGEPLQSAAIKTDPASAPAAESLQPAESEPKGPPSLPDSTAASAAVASEAAVCEPASRVLDLGPILNLALLPVAAVITGAGLLILNRMRTKLPRHPPADQPPAHGGNADHA